MDVTIMPATSLLDRLARDFPSLTFEKGDVFRWSPVSRVVTYADTNNLAQLLHEVGHANLKHADYSRDIELIEMERDAWSEARSLAERYGVVVTPETVEVALDSYRDWLHARSTCPNCQAIGIQTKRSEYRCLACSHHWRVNDARICQLRRYVIKK